MSTIDPSKVKPGDTVTLERDTALARDVVERIDSYPQGGFSIVLRETNPAYLTVTGWTITDHQPAPAPEWEPGTPGTATVGGANGEVELRGMWTQRGSKAPAVFTDLEGDIWGSSLVRSFVPDDIEALRAELDAARTQVSDLTGRNAALEALVQEQKQGIQARDTWIEDQADDT